MKRFAVATLGTTALATPGMAGDEYVFLAGPLHNIALTAPRFHSGKARDLHAAAQIMAESHLGKDLTDGDTNRIVAFPGSRTGALPEISTPVLSADAATTPRPSAEVLAK